MTTYLNRTIRDEAAKVHDMGGEFYVVVETSYRTHQTKCSSKMDAETLAYRINTALEDSFLRQADALFSVLPR